MRLHSLLTIGCVISGFALASVVPSVLMDWPELDAQRSMVSHQLWALSVNSRSN